MTLTSQQVQRALRTNRTGIIGLLVENIMNPYYAVLARAVDDAAKESGYVVLLSNDDGRMGDFIEEPEFDVVGIDLRQAASLVVAHLFEQGHRRIGYVGPMAKTDRFTGVWTYVPVANALGTTVERKPRLSRLESALAEFLASQGAADRSIVSCPAVR